MSDLAPSAAENPSQAQPNWPPVVVGGAFQTGLNLMRDLLGHGVRTVAVDYDLTHQGFRSAYGKTYQCPNPDTDPSQWLAFMKNLSAELGQKPLFIAAADVFITAIAKHGPDLTAHYLNLPEVTRLQAELCSKETQYALCAKHGFPCPRLAYVRSQADLDRFSAEARFPCLIKPLTSREWDSLPPGNPAFGKKIVIARTAEELAGIYQSIAVFRSEAITQELIAGLGNQKRVYFTAFGAGSTCLGQCMVKELRPYPAILGMPPVTQPVHNDELLALCSGFLQKIGYRGICEFEFKLDERDGLPRLIEINPRFSGSGDVAGYMGIETGWLHYLDLTGHTVAPVRPAHFDFHHIAVKLEASETVPCVLNGQIPWRDFFAPYKGKRKYFDLDWHDRRLAWETLRTAVRSAAGGLWRHLRGTRPAAPTS